MSDIARPPAEVLEPAEVTERGLPPDLTVQEILDLIFRNPAVQHRLSEFDDLGVPLDSLLQLRSRELPTTGGSTEVRYYVRCLKRNVDIQILSARKASPEEIVRQFWLHKLTRIYHYPLEQIAVDYRVAFGTVAAEKAVDILVFQEDGATAKIVLELKQPQRRGGISQLKSYLNAEGSPIGVWSNGRDRLILYRPYPRQDDDTLPEIPAFGQRPEHVLAAPLALSDCRREFDFRRIVQDVEELVLTNAGADEFNEILKIVFAKMFDEYEAPSRPNAQVRFRKSTEPNITYDTVDELFRRATAEWPGIFESSDRIILTPQHLQVVVGPLERIRLLGANMRMMDDAFEYLMPSDAKKKNGQFFTPRYVIDMAVKMLNPGRREYVLDPACGSGGFLNHAMEFVWRGKSAAQDYQRKAEYARRHLWGFDLDERSAKVARALMLIAGHGRSHIFRVNSLDPQEWFNTPEGESLRSGLRAEGLLQIAPSPKKPPHRSDAWIYLTDLAFDVILTNPPFGAETHDQGLLGHYELAQRSLAKSNPREERDVLFLERSVRCLKPGGRMAIVLPQGRLSNVRFAYVREWLLRCGRLLAVVGLHSNTFKPYSATKTSVLLFQKYTTSERQWMERAEAEMRASSPDYEAELHGVLELDDEQLSAAVPEAVADFLATWPDEVGESSMLTGGYRADAEDVTDFVDAVQAQQGRVAELADQLNRNRADTDRSSAAATRSLLARERRRLQQLERDVKSSTLRGRIELLLTDAAALEDLRQHWIDTQLAARLNYPIFMAVSETGGKMSSGEHRYRVDSLGNRVEDSEGNALIEQDLVKYRDNDPDGIAEMFLKWGHENGLSFLQDI